MLLRFLKHPDASSFNITVLVRSLEKAEKLKAFGVNPVVGSHSDIPLVEGLTAQADVVIAAVRTSASYLLCTVALKADYFLERPIQMMS